MHRRLSRLFVAAAAAAAGRRTDGGPTSGLLAMAFVSTWPPPPPPPPRPSSSPSSHHRSPPKGVAPVVRAAGRARSGGGGGGPLFMSLDGSRGDALNFRSGRDGADDKTGQDTAAAAASALAGASPPQAFTSAAAAAAAAAATANAANNAATATATATADHTTAWTFPPPAAAAAAAKEEAAAALGQAGGAGGAEEGEAGAPPDERRRLSGVSSGGGGSHGVAAAAFMRSATEPRELVAASTPPRLSRSSLPPPGQAASDAVPQGWPSVHPEEAGKMSSDWPIKPEAGKPSVPVAAPVSSRTEEEETAVEAATDSAADQRGGEGGRRSAAKSRSGVDKVNEASRISGGPLSGLTDGLSGFAFAALHALDDCGVQDAAKNLRVLWTRALLANSGELADDVAFALLPESTRWVVGKEVVGSGFWDGLLPFCEWIQSRTAFLDQVLDSFLAPRLAARAARAAAGGTEDDAPPYQVVVVGAGYDTRSLRKQGPHVRFFEVDLPEIVEGKKRLYGKYAAAHPERALLPSMLGMDLDDCASLGENPDQGLLARLQREHGLQPGVPTLVLFEAVMFYLEPETVEGLFGELMAFSEGRGLWSNQGGCELVLGITDSLKGLGVTKPFMPDVAALFREVYGMELLSHRAQWGGAVHFTAMVNHFKGPTSTVPSLVEKAASTTAAASSSSALATATEAAAATTPAAEKAAATAATAAAAAAAGATAPRASPTPHAAPGASPLKSKPAEGPGHGGLPVREHMLAAWPRPFDSYIPQYTLQSAALLEKPSFRNCWYAVGLSTDLPTVPSASAQQSAFAKDSKAQAASSPQPYATRLWGEPLLLYRDKDGGVVCLRDVCPHRAAPLSMGSLTDQGVSCFYHGWTFGARGDRVSEPTRGQDKPLKECAVHYAAAEVNGMVFVWAGHTLEANPALLPTQREGEKTLFVDTVLDYNVDWTYIVENNLDSPHIYWLHDGSIPPLEGLGFNRDHVDSFSLRKFKDAVGVGHVGKTAGQTTTKVVRFDAPNVVRHGGVSGFAEEFHVIPVAPHRSRVLLRQHFPKGPTLSLVANNDLLMRGFSDLLNWWNYNIACEDYSVMQGQAHNIEDLGAPHLGQGALGDDLIGDFYSWRAAAEANDGSSPYFARWGGSAKRGGARGTPQGGSGGLGRQPAASASAAAASASASAASAAASTSASASAASAFAEGDGRWGGKAGDDDRVYVDEALPPQRPGTAPSYGYAMQDDGASGQAPAGDRSPAHGTWGIKRSYVQQTPAATQPPVNNELFRKQFWALRLAEKAAEAATQPATAAATVTLCASFLLIGAGGGGGEAFAGFGLPQAMAAHAAATSGL